MQRETDSVVQEELEVGGEDKDFVISEQPMSVTDASVPCSETDCAGPQCEEPNNNSNKPTAPVPSALALSSTLELVSTDRHTMEKGQTKSSEELSTHNALQNADAPPRVDTAKRHSLKLRERIFQFPLCEKALAFNLPAQNKSKILPMAQYNCCRVL